MLEDTDGAVIAFILYRDIKEQRENAAKLRDLIDLPVTEVALKGDNLNPVRTFLSLPKEPRQALFFTFLGSSLPEGKSDFDKFAGYVNIQREAFTDAPHAVVLWLREEQLVRLMKRAPDFWAWRSGVFDVRGELQPDTSAYRELEEIDTFERGDLEHQVALYREILKAQLAREEPDLAYVARTILRLTDVLQSLGLYEEAVMEAQKTFVLAEVLEDIKLRSNGLNSLALGYKVMARYEEAEPLFREALKIDEEVLGKEHIDYTTVLSNLGGLLDEMGRYEEAEPILREALEINEKILGQRHPNYAIDLGNLAGLLENLGCYDEAEALFREATDTILETQGKSHPAYTNILSNLANLLVETERYDEAELLYRKAVAVDEEVRGKEHPSYANGLNNLANLLKKTGRYSDAELLYTKALSICEDRLGEDHPHTRLVANNYRLLLQELEQQTSSPPSG